MSAMLQAISRRLRTEGETYQGLSIGCAPGTHAGLVELIMRHVHHRRGVLDLGAHSGALLARLRDKGFEDLHAADLDTTRLQLPGVPLTRVDLNTRFSEQFDRRFKLICCTDVIEHLDSPRAFVTEAARLLDDDGYLALSLPNIAFWEGRFKFFLTGELWGFGERNYRKQRHISPMTMDQMRLMMEELGYQVLGQSSAGSFATPLRKVMLFPLWGPLRVALGPAALGESALILAMKGPPNLELLLPHDYRQRWQRSAAQTPATTDKNAASSHVVE